MIFIFYLMQKCTKKNTDRNRNPSCGFLQVDYLIKPVRIEELCNMWQHVNQINQIYQVTLRHSVRPWQHVNTHCNCSHHDLSCLTQVDYQIKPVRIEELRNMWQHVVRRRLEGEPFGMDSSE